jgi:hypothetical protein
VQALKYEGRGFWLVALSVGINPASIFSLKSILIFFLSNGNQLKNKKLI